MVGGGRLLGEEEPLGMVASEIRYNQRTDAGADSRSGPPLGWGERQAPPRPSPVFHKCPVGGSQPELIRKAAGFPPGIPGCSRLSGVLRKPL